jgi:hypothetical protein
VCNTNFFDTEARDVLVDVAPLYTIPVPASLTLAPAEYVAGAPVHVDASGTGNTTAVVHQTFVDVYFDAFTRHSVSVQGRRGHVFTATDDVECVGIHVLDPPIALHRRAAGTAAVAARRTTGTAAVAAGRTAGTATDAAAAAVTAAAAVAATAATAAVTATAATTARVTATAATRVTATAATAVAAAAATAAVAAAAAAAVTAAAAATTVAGATTTGATLWGALYDTIIQRHRRAIRQQSSNDQGPLCHVDGHCGQDGATEVTVGCQRNGRTHLPEDIVGAGAIVQYDRTSSRQG